MISKPRFYSSLSDSKNYVLLLESLIKLSYMVLQQVGQLKVEHTTLLKQLTDINHKFDEASVDNRILKADIETLRAKVFPIVSFYPPAFFACSLNDMCPCVVQSILCDFLTLTIVTEVSGHTARILVSVSLSW